jgi:hypothetical protein
VLQHRNLDGTVTILPTADGLPSLSFAENICNNTLVGVHYTVIYEVPGDISRVEAEVTVAEVQGNVDGSGQVLQEFTVTFADGPDAVSPPPLTCLPLHMTCAVVFSFLSVGKGLWEVHGLCRSTLMSILTASHRFCARCI